MTNIVQGNALKVSVSFTNLSGSAVDPTTVTFRLSTPTSTSTTAFVYPSASLIVKDSTGNYHATLDVSAAGPWLYRWEGTGALEAAVQGMSMCSAAAPV